MSALLLFAAQAVAPLPPRTPYASAAEFTCEFYNEKGKKKTLSGHIDPIMASTGYGTAGFRLKRDDIGLMQGAKSAMMTGSPKLPRWYQIAVPVAGGKEYMMQLYLNGKGAAGNGFITLQEGGLKVGGYGTVAAGLCYSDFGAVQ